MMRTSVITLGLLVLPLVAPAHHSTAEYDQSVIHEVQGEVVKVQWRNPHVLFELRTVSQDGQEELWNVESGSVSHLDRLGIRRDAIGVGDTVTIAGYRSSRRNNHLEGTNALLATGTEIVLNVNGTPHWSGEYLGGGDWIRDAPEGAISDGEGLFRVWSWDRSQTYLTAIPVDELRLTRTAAEAAAEWNNERDNPVLQCTPPGMPATMGNPYPIEFARSGSNIEMLIEEFDLVRTIHMVEQTSVEAVPSHLGHSVGHWEVDTLVVVTDRVNWPYFNRTGVPQSEAIELAERFTVDAEMNLLDYELTITDPATFTEPYRWEAHWLWRPGEEIKPYNCVLDE